MQPSTSQCPYMYIYRIETIELADSLCEITTKDMQETVDNAGISGHVKKKNKWDEHSALNR